MGYLLAAFALGLSTGLFCLAWCGAILLPFLLSEQRKLREGFFLVLKFSLGRLIAYILFGFGVGYLGYRISDFSLFHKLILPFAYIFLSIFLIVYSKRSWADKKFCLFPKRFASQGLSAGGGGFPFVFGFLTGINLCPAFCLAAFSAAALGNFWKGGLYFFMFFLGTSVYLFSLPFLGGLSRLKSIRVAARYAALIIGLWFFYLGASNLVQSRLAAAEKSLPSTSLYEVMPGADEFSPSQEEPYCYYAFQGGKLTGLCFVTTEVELGIVGYSGPVPVLAGLSLDGRITSIKILENRETQNIVRGIYKELFLSQYEGKSIKDAFRVGVDLDGITGATITVRAINESLKKASEKIARHYLGIFGESEVKKPGAYSGIGIFAQPLRAGAGFFTAGLFLFAVIGFFLKRNVLRYVCMGVAIVYLGFYRKTLFVTADIIKFLAHQMNPERYLFVGLVLLITILFGRLYCGRLCPFGAVIEFLNRIVKFNLKFPSWLARRLRWLRLIILGVLLVIFFITGKFALIEVEPFKELFHLKATAIRWIFLSGVLIISAFSSRFWCKYLCPAGAFLSLLSRLRFFPYKRKTTQPTNCNLCRQSSKDGAPSTD